MHCAPSRHVSCTVAYCTMCDLLMSVECPTPVYMICVLLSIHTNEPKHYDHLPNVLLVLCLLPKQLQPAQKHGLSQASEGALLYLAPRCYHHVLQCGTNVVWTHCSDISHRTLVTFRPGKYRGQGNILNSSSCFSNHS